MLHGRTGTGLRRLVDPRRVAFAFVVGLFLLVADNVYWLVRNEVELPCAEKVCVSPRSIEEVSRRYPNQQIVTLANWYFLNQWIAHSRLAIPSRLSSQKTNLEKLARLRVEVSDKPFIIAPQHISRLLATSTQWRPFQWRRRRKTSSSYLYLRFDPQASDYVLA